MVTMKTPNLVQKSIKNPTKLPEWAKLLKTKRQSLNESQADFGHRFKVTRAAVSYWESGTYEPPAEVLMWLLKDQTDVV